MPRKPELGAGLMGPRGPNADFTYLNQIAGLSLPPEVKSGLLIGRGRSRGSNSCNLISYSQISELYYYQSEFNLATRMQ